MCSLSLTVSMTVSRVWETMKSHHWMLPRVGGDSAGRMGKVEVTHAKSEHMKAQIQTSKELGVAGYCWIIAEFRNACLVTGVHHK